jgi:hypothetical protein
VELYQRLLTLITMKSHKYKHGSRINWRTLTISLSIAGCFFVSNYSNRDDTYYADEPKVSVYMEAVVVEATSTPESVEDKIKHYFKRSSTTMLAIAHAESGMRMESINWNCYYNKDKTIVYETRVKGSHGAACKKEHRKYAFGVDCFLLQAHYPGRKDCPKDVTIDEHLQEMAELSKKRSFQPWVAYNNGSYKKFLASK